MFVLAIVGALSTDKLSHSIAEPHNIHYKNLQKCYLLAYFFATFADWLQGPYIYKLYSDYGYSNDTIAYLYITGFASGCIFGTVVGQLADRYGRKILCTSYTVFYTLCCLTKTSSNFSILICGKILGGISTSILFTTFEAWYLNEHLNFYKLPVEWLNVTFSKATFYNGISAIVAGLTGQILAEYLNFGPVSPFLLAVPVLFISFIIIQSTWKEHNDMKTRIYKDSSSVKQFFSPLKLLLDDEKILLNLGLIQCTFESVMYVFIFSWTPILSSLKPPLGLVFTLFMIALILGSKFYSVLISKRYYPQNLLIFSTILASFAFIMISLSLTTLAFHVVEHDAEPSTIKSMSYMCLIAFIIYEFSLGMYYPSIGFLRGRVVPEEYRATLTNWFRVPMNIIICISLSISEGNHYGELKALKKFQFLFLICSFILSGTVFLTFIFSKKYVRKIVHDELAEVRAGKGNVGETV